MFLFYVHTKLFQKKETLFKGGHYLRKYSNLFQIHRKRNKWDALNFYALE